MNNAGRIAVGFAVAALVAIPVGTQLGTGSAPVVNPVQGSSVVSVDAFGDDLAQINAASEQLADAIDAINGVVIPEAVVVVPAVEAPVVEDVLPNESHEQAEADLLYEVSVQCADEVNGRLDAAAEGEIGPEGIPSPAWDDLVAQCAALMVDGASQAEAIVAVLDNYDVVCTEDDGCFVVYEN